MFLGSAGAAIFLGLADYLASLLGSLGMKGLFAEWIGCIAMFSLYHTMMILLWYCDKDRNPNESYFSAETSMYYEKVENDFSAVDGSQAKPADSNAKAEYQFSGRRVWGMVTRIIF